MAYLLDLNIVYIAKPFVGGVLMNIINCLKCIWQYWRMHTGAVLNAQRCNISVGLFKSSTMKSREYFIHCVIATLQYATISDWFVDCETLC